MKNNGVVLFLIMNILTHIKIISTQVMFKFTKEKLNFLQFKYPKNIKENCLNKNQRYSQSRNILKRSPSLIKETKLKINEKLREFCNINNCNAPHGKCIDLNECKCLDPYTNLVINSNKENFVDINHKCRYKKKSQLFAFILEIIFMVGFGHLYLLRYKQGIIKISLIFLIILVNIFIRKNNANVKFFSGENNSMKNFMLNIFLILLVASLLIIQTYDLIMLGNNNYLDGNGIPLISWNKSIDNWVIFNMKENNSDI